MGLTKRKPQAQTRSKDADVARLTAAEHCLLRYPTLYTAGVPRPGRAPLWHVPIVISHPTQGIMGTVGELVVDVRLGKVVKEPAHEEVLTAGRALAQVKQNGQKATPAASTRARG
jgi:hypothetical protein